MKNNFKRALSTLLVSIMLFALLPLSAFAAFGDYTNLDFSQVLADGTTITTFADTDTTYIYLGNPINRGGYGFGYTVELEANVNYVATVYMENLLGEYEITRSIALLKNELSGDIETDLIDYTYGANYGSDTFVFRFTAPATGTYKLMHWGHNKDSENQPASGADTNKIEFTFAKETFEVFEISSSDDLLKFNENVTNGIPTAYNLILDFKADIDMTNIEWTPVDATENKITILGNYRYIKGLGATLIKFAETFKAENLGIEVDLNFDDPSSDYYYATPFFGFALEAIMSNCHAIGEININALNCETATGLAGDVYFMSLENCSSNVDINVTVANEASYISGIMSYEWGNGVYKNCHYNGNISIKGGNGNVYRIGGFGAYIDCYDTFENCSAAGSITISGFERSEDSKDIGGFIGYVNYGYNTFLNCITDIDISAPSYYHVGGFMGYLNDRNNTFKNCYTSGNVEGFDYVGGFGGISEGTNAFTNCYTTGNVKGNNYVGGFMGEERSSLFKTCYTSGSVSGNSAESALGSFLGYASATPAFQRCYAQEKSLSFIGMPVGETPSGLFEGNFASEIWTEYAVNDLNNMVSLLSDPELLNWVTVPNSTPTFILPKIDSPKKPCIHTYDGILDGWDDEHHWELCENENCPYADEPYNSVNHTFETVSDTADCENDGVLTKKCTDCNHTVETDSFAKGHTDENGDSVCDICGYVEYILGDVNADGKVDADDYILLKRVYFGMAKLENLDNPDTALVRSDVHGADSKITGDDYILLKRVYFGMAKLG